MAPTEEGTRLVWHFQALDEARTFTVGYRLSGLALAYDDVVDVTRRSGATSGKSRWAA